MAWEMKVPVLSTLHVPGDEALKKFCEENASATGEGYNFIFVDLDWIWEGDEAWMEPIADWMEAKGYTDWVRFDADGDVIPGLPTYEEKWP